MEKSCSNCLNNYRCPNTDDGTPCDDYACNPVCDQFMTTVLEVRKEYQKALEKHPEFPESNTNAQSVIMEEVLEALTAFNDGDLDNYKMELKHVVVTCIRELQALG